MLSIYFLFLSLLAHHQSHDVLAQGTSDTDCQRVLTDYQANECLNVSTDIEAPSPVVLESTITNDNFICKDRPTLYTFSCTVYGSELVWHFKDSEPVLFQSYDPIGTTFSMSYPQSAPVYNVTATLTLVSNQTLSGYNVPFCVSILMIQSFNESQTDAPVIPFNVSCQTFCKNNHTQSEVCRVKDYQVAETPTAPEELTGTIQNISDDTLTLAGAKAVSFINWSMPENNMDNIAVDYFEITLMGTHTNNTMSVRMAESDQYLQTFSQKYVLPEGNYTSVSITAVDLCDKRSNRIQVQLTNTTMVSTCAPNLAPDAKYAQQNEAAITGGVLGVLLLISVVIAAAALLAAVIILVRCPRHKGKESDKNISNEGNGMAMTPIQSAN